MTHWGVTAWDWVKRQPPVCKGRLASQPHSVPQHRSLSPRTESDRRCGTEWGWLTSDKGSVDNMKSILKSPIATQVQSEQTKKCQCYKEH